MHILVKCPFCQLDTYTQEWLVNHVMSCSKKPEGAMICMICHDIFRTWKNLSAHIKHKHPDSIVRY